MINKQPNPEVLHDLINKQNEYIDFLHKEFDRFTILQVTHLHLIHYSEETIQKGMKIRAEIEGLKNLIWPKE